MPVPTSSACIGADPRAGLWWPTDGRRLIRPRCRSGRMPGAVFRPKPVATATSEVAEALEDLDRARTDDDHEQGRQHADDQGEYDLDWRLCRLGLDRLTPLDPELRRLCAQNARDRHPEDVGLDHRQSERIQLLDVCALCEVPEGIGPRHTQLDLLQHPREL